MKTAIALALALIVVGAVVFRKDAKQPVFGGNPTWVHTVGTDLYDTPSGNLDVGYYVIQSNGTLLAHRATTTLVSATTSNVVFPAGIYGVAVAPGGFTQAHIIGTRYIDYFSDGSSQIGDPVLDASLSQKNAPTPTKGAANTTVL